MGPTVHFADKNGRGPHVPKVQKSKKLGFLPTEHLSGDPLHPTVGTRLYLSASYNNLVFILDLFKERSCFHFGIGVKMCFDLGPLREP